MKHEKRQASMKLSTKSRYSARILIELARHTKKTPLQTSRISLKQHIPMKYLEQLITILRKAGFIKSFRGPKGGHLLDMDPADITLGQLVRMFEGQTELVTCVTANEKCLLADECHLRIAWQDATKSLYEKLDKITIKGLVEQNENDLKSEFCHKHTMKH